MNQKLLIALAMLFAIHVPVFAQRPADIVGVTIGMTADQAREALKKSGTPFKLLEGRYEAQPGIPESLAYINACVANAPPYMTGCGGMSDKSAKDQVLVAFGQMSGKVFFVERTWQPTKDAQPLANSVEKAVLEKYTGLKKSGESSTNRMPTGRSYSDTNGLNGRPEAQCGFGSGMTIPNSARSNCGFAAHAGVEFEGELQKLTKLRIGIFDHRVLLSDINQSNEILSGAAKKQRANEENAARKVGAPKL